MTAEDIDLLAEQANAARLGVLRLANLLGDDPAHAAAVAAARAAGAALEALGHELDRIEISGAGECPADTSTAAVVPQGMLYERD